ncbi:Na(+)/citrate cotransporter-like [Dermacentor variabilis]|uniref:Na(+)/citrate cotransporter-like n=1 Tax=Dermacentor variabilis TaxID=34621 RepID=UPI003F5B246D
MSVIQTARFRWRFFSIFAAPVLFLPLAFIIGGKAGWCAYVILWMAFYWTAEVVPLAITSLMPIVLFPLLGILSSQRVSSFYFNEVGIILVCAMMLGVAVETSNLHKRIALKSLLAIGTSNRRLLLGLMLVTMFLSMWIPNIAAASIMIPIAMAVVDQIGDRSATKIPIGVRGQQIGSDEKRLIEDRECTVSLVQENETPRTEDRRTRLLRTTLVLGVSYATSIGGTGSLIGTGPNVLLKGIIEDMFPGSTEITFVTWILYNGPTMLLCTLLSWAYMQWNAREAMRSEADESTKEKVREEIAWRYKELGKISFAEICVAALIGTMIIAWFAMKPQMFPGWVDAIPHGELVKPSALVAFMALLLFVIPKDPGNPWQSQPLLTWEEAVHGVKWGVMILVGGGMTLSEACKQSGLSSMLVDNVKGMNVLPPALTALLFCFAASMFTEITSNTATSSLLLPLVCDMAVALRLHPIYLGMPVAVACSFSFIIPAGTPPNAIAYDLAKLRIPDMAKPGFFVNLICVAIEVVMIHTLGFPIFGLSTFPEWAEPYRHSLNGSILIDATSGSPTENTTITISAGRATSW